ncbi:MULTISPECIES: aspartate/glutamate racemase family protein [unclassified Mesorhizobium]|uniref:maleate cis-trans isomerase family protein n=1 Tax=unclassified Mesorhizobium TaxID=325217 RepID=UPI000413B37B|nr:aspartate/glutamate racemase family protein [Mesorhizobium sp. LSJC268A00]
MNHLRIGVIYPSDGIQDREFWQFAPPHTTMHVTRVPFPEPPVNLEMLRALVDDGDLDQAAQVLRPIKPAAIAYACTSVSFARGHAGDRSILDRISRGANAPATSTSSALVAACRALGVRKLALGAPYPSDTTALFERYLTEAGLEPLSIRSLGLEEGIGELESEAIADLASAADVPQAEAIVLACTDLKTYSVIAELERALGKPVITANQATVWHACRIAGSRGTDGVGRLWRVNAIEKPFVVSE